MPQGARAELLAALVDMIESFPSTRPVRVGFDGPPAAGKTTMADEVGALLHGRGRQVIRASIESFLLPRVQRYRRGEHSPVGCYHDSFDFEALHGVLLDPLGPGGDRRFQTAVYDNATDSSLPRSLSSASVDAVLLFDGVFLGRPELVDRWELHILVSATFERTLARAQIREQAQWEAAYVEQRWRERYLPSQQFYNATVRPGDHADMIVHNDDLECPTWTVVGR